MVTTTKRWMSVALLSMLAIGVGAGILIDRLVLAPTVSSDVRAGDGHHRDHGGRMVARLRERLDLTEKQASELEEVMNRNHETARQFWSESRDEYEALRKQFRRDIRELLTEAQRREFDDMVSEYEQKRRSRHDR